METVILTDNQSQVIRLFSANAELSKQYYLSGGTALSAFYLHHRESDDLDFFSDDPAPLSVLTSFATQIKESLSAASMSYEHLYDRHIFTFHTKSLLKVEFTKYPFIRLDTFLEKDGIHIDSLLDISVNKLFALFDRNEPKDFVDLFFILQQIPLNELVFGVKKKFDMTISPLTLGSELLKVRHLELFPRMKILVTKQELVSFFEELVYKIGKDVVS